MRQLKAIILLFTFFFSITGNAVMVHTCHGKVKDISFIKSDKCCDKKEEPKKKHNCCKKKVEKKCCESEGVQGCDNCELDQLIDSDNFEMAQFDWADVQLVIAFCYASYLDFIPETTSKVDYITYDPPFFDRDIPVLVQSFLI